MASTEPTKESEPVAAEAAAAAAASEGTSEEEEGTETAETVKVALSACPMESVVVYTDQCEVTRVVTHEFAVRACTTCASRGCRGWC